MKKLITLLVTLILIFSLSACGKNDNTTTPSIDNTPSTTIPSDTTTPSDEPKEDESYLSKTLILTLATTKVGVYWMDNDSVREVKKLANDGLITVNMTMNEYAQIGLLTSGVSITSADINITTSAGDICLYNGDQLVIFYGTHTGNYTKLGHISLSKAVLIELLTDEDSITITLNLK